MTAAATAEAKTHGTVRISLPANVAYQPDNLKKTIAGLMERLGCTRCFSGADCFFTMERDFVINPQNVLTSQTLERPAAMMHTHSATVSASLGRGVRYDIDKVFKAVDKVIATLGPCPCHSGYDVLYQNELPMIGINEKLEAQQYGG